MSFGFVTFHQHSYIGDFSDYCPYTICRKNVLHFANTYVIQYGLYISSLLGLLQILISFCLMLLVCVDVRNKAILRVVPVDEENNGQIMQERQVMEMLSNNR